MKKRIPKTTEGKIIVDTKNQKELKCPLCIGGKRFIFGMILRKDNLKPIRFILLPKEPGIDNEEITPIEVAYSIQIHSEDYSLQETVSGKFLFDKDNGAHKMAFRIPYETLKSQNWFKTGPNNSYRHLFIDYSFTSEIEEGSRDDICWNFASDSKSIRAVWSIPLSNFTKDNDYTVIARPFVFDGKSGKAIKFTHLVQLSNPVKFSFSFLKLSSKCNPNIQLQCFLLNINQENNIEFTSSAESLDTEAFLDCYFGNLDDLRKKGFIQTNSQTGEYITFSWFLPKFTDRITSALKGKKYPPKNGSHYYYDRYPNQPDFSEMISETAKKVRTEAPYVGLRNQGATCYMNSMLQALFHLPSFRRLVYEMKDSGKEEVKNIPLNLQRLFCRMQIGKEACSTKPLTVSFGWDDDLTFVQHDIQEFCKKLIDNLETKMKGTTLEGSVARLFKGKTKKTIKCLHVDYETSHIDEFYELTLVIRNCKNLRASFQAYVEKSTFEGDNKYNTETPEYGKQDAEMSVKFIEFPPVLQLHLVRFEYDPQTDRMGKITDRYEFPDSIDLSEFLADEVNPDKSPVYDLFGVLVHSGTIYGGHYYAYLRTSTSTQWYEFNDSIVSNATAEEAVTDNFGGPINSNPSYNWNSNYPNYNYNYGYRQNNDKSYSAYMLIYVRREDQEQIFSQIPEEAIPESLRNWVNDHDDRDYKTNYVAKMNDGKFSVYTEELFKILSEQGHLGLSCPENKRIIKLEPEMTDAEIYTKIGELYNLKPNAFRLWTGNNIPSVLVKNTPLLKVSDFYSNYLFIQFKDEEEKLELNYGDVVVFIKFYMPGTQCPLQYLGSLLVKQEQSLLDLIPWVKEKVGFDTSNSIEPKFDVYTEKLDEVVLIKQKKRSFAEKGIWTGHRFVFQIKPGTPIPPYSLKFEKPILSPLPTDELISEIPAESKEVKEDKKETTEAKEVKEETTMEKTAREEKERNAKLPVFNYEFDAGVSNLLQFYEQKQPLIKARVKKYENYYEPLAFIGFPASISWEKLKYLIAKSLHIHYDPLINSMNLYKKEYNKDSPSSNPLWLNFPVSSDFNTTYSSNTDGFYDIFCEFIPDVSEANLTNCNMVGYSYSEDGRKVVKKGRICVNKSTTFGELITKLKIQGTIPEDGEYKYYHTYHQKIYRIIGEKSIVSSALAIRIDKFTPPNLQLNEVTVAFAAVNRATNPYSGIYEPFLLNVSKDKVLKDLLKELTDYLQVPVDESAKNYFVITSGYSVSDADKEIDLDLTFGQALEQFAATSIQKVETPYLYLVIPKGKSPKSKQTKSSYRSREPELKLFN